MVYIIAEDGTQYIKIGRTTGAASNLFKRRDELQVGNPRRLLPLAMIVTPGAVGQSTGSRASDIRLETVIRDQIALKVNAERVAGGSEWLRLPCSLARMLEEAAEIAGSNDAQLQLAFDGMMAMEES